MDLESDSKKLRDAFDAKPGLEEIFERVHGEVVRWKRASAAMVGNTPYFTDVSWSSIAHRYERADRRWSMFGKARHGIGTDGLVRVIQVGADEVLVDRSLTHEDWWTSREGKLVLLERWFPESAGKRSVLSADRGSMKETLYERMGPELVVGTTRKIVQARDGAPARHYLDSVVESFHVSERGLRSIFREVLDRAGRPVGRTCVFVSLDGREDRVLLEDMQRRLVDGVLRTVREHPISVPCRALLLVYCGEDPDTSFGAYDLMLVPQHVAPRTDPDELRGVEGVIRVPACDDEAYDEACAAFASGPSRPVEVLLQPVFAAARSLNQIDWSSILPTTGDFVVVARDNTNAFDWDHDLEQSGANPQ